LGIGKYDGNEMDKVWSEKNKEIQKLLTKEATFEEAIGFYNLRMVIDRNETEKRRNLS